MANIDGLKFFDCNCAFGPYRTRVFRFSRTAAELVEEMDFANIERALVYHTAMRFDHPQVGNERVVRERRPSAPACRPGRCFPARPGNSLHWKRCSSKCGSTTCGVAAVPRRPSLFPRRNHLGRPDAPSTMERRIPLFIRAQPRQDRQAAAGRSPSWSSSPAARGANPLDRYAWPLVEKYPNLIFETSGYLVDGGIEEFCRRYSASPARFRLRLSRQRQRRGHADAGTRGNLRQPNGRRSPGKT